MKDEKNLGCPIFAASFTAKVGTFDRAKSNGGDRYLGPAETVFCGMIRSDVQEIPEFRSDVPLLQRGA